MSEQAAVTESGSALLLEVADLNLPNLVETVRMGQEIADGEFSPVRPLAVRPPLPGRYTTRPGERLSRRDLMDAADEWLTETDGCTRLIIQGGNRYITTYAAEVFGEDIPDVKVMSVEKAPLSTQLLTILSAEERQAHLSAERLAEILPALPPKIAAKARLLTRSELLQEVADMTLQGPFQPNTSDDALETELSQAVERIESGITIPNQDVITSIMRGTKIADSLQKDEQIHFLDDLFYRGRTLYSLAILITACGGNPTNMNLTTLCSDVKSAGLESPYHKILRSGMLYPFENSIRTEQGYWQDVGTHYVFTDMGAYWEHLATVVDRERSQGTYEAWQAAIHDWSEQNLSEQLGDIDMTLAGPLIWLSVYHQNFGLDLDIDRVVDQKGYKIGACVPFAQLIDRFISQEEPVEVRRQFKEQIRQILSAVSNAAIADPDTFQYLINMYAHNQNAIDFGGLSFMSEHDFRQVEYSLAETATGQLMNGVAETIASRALESERPHIVGVNGVDGSGKTTLTGELQRQLEDRGLSVTVVHIDDFTQPYTVRSASDDPVDRYYNHTFDVETLRRAILEPVAAGWIGSVLLTHESPNDTSKVVEHAYSFKPGPSIVLVEGVFVFRPELSDYFGTKIFIDIPVAEMRSRAIERDVPRFGFGVLKKYLSRYIPAQLRYLAAVRPTEIADIVIDNTDRHNPFIVNRKIDDVQQATA